MNLLSAAVALSDDRVPSLGTREWFAEFLLSPAVAGLAAVVAAGVGVWTTWARIRTDRELAREERGRAAAAAALLRQAEIEDRDRAQWWETYRWAVDHVDRIAPVVALDFFSQLGSAAPDPVSVALVGVALNQYQDTLDEEAEPDGS